MFTGRLLLVGATNRPQELDDGARRRLAKQLYIPLPCADARRAIVTNILDADESVSSYFYYRTGNWYADAVFCSQVTHRLSDADLDVICEKTDGYSGSDMKHLVQEAARAPPRGTRVGGVGSPPRGAKGGLRESNPRPPRPKRGIMPLDQVPFQTRSATLSSGLF